MEARQARFPGLDARRCVHCGDMTRRAGDKPVCYACWAASRAARIKRAIRDHAARENDDDGGISIPM